MALARYQKGALTGLEKPMIASSKKLLPSFAREIQSATRRDSKSVRPVGTPLDAAQLKLVVGGSRGACLPGRSW